MTEAELKAELAKLRLMVKQASDQVSLTPKEIAYHRERFQKKAYVGKTTIPQSAVAIRNMRIVEPKSDAVVAKETKQKESLEGRIAKLRAQLGL